MSVSKFERTKNIFQTFCNFANFLF